MSLVAQLPTPFTHSAPAMERPKNLDLSQYEIRQIHQVPYGRSGGISDEVRAEKERQISQSWNNSAKERLG